jgi:hypothetical protein
MEVAHRRAITHFKLELLLKPAIDFDPRPVNLSGLVGIL